MYDSENKVWSHSINDVGKDASSWFGASASISSDGTVVAVTTASYYDLTCFAHVYHYDKVEHVWIERGECLGDAQIVMAYVVKLSSNGFVLAIGIPSVLDNNVNVGDVRIYEFDEITTNWQKTGHFFGEEECNFNGASISLSVDGSVLAFAGTIAGPIQTFEFNTKPDYGTN